jgi:tetratricopeptide (TPR) repeat protein
MIARPKPESFFVMKTKTLLSLFLLICLLGCSTGSIKPMLNDRQFRAENEPLRTLKVLLVTDNTFRKDEIDRFVSKCSRLIEMQVGIRLEIVDGYEIKWADELKEMSRMITRVAWDTWSKRNDFDVIVAPVYFSHRIDVGRVLLGSIDTFFWRYIFIKELDPTVLLHEVFHAFLLEEPHSSEDWVMNAERSPYGIEWYWLTPAERSKILRTKWRDFNVMPATAKEEERKPMTAWFYYSLGVLSLQKKDFDQAILFLDKSLEVESKHAEVYNARGIARISRKQSDLGLADYDKAIEINPDFVPPYYNRARLLETQGDFGRAISDLNKALEINPNYVVAHNSLARLLATAKSPAYRDGRKALEHALKACDLTNRDNPAFLDTLAAAYARAGDFDSAVRWQQKALEYPELSKNQEAQRRLNLYRERKPFPPE